MRWLVVITLAVCASARSYAGPDSEWSRFRGPNGSGVADDQRPPVEFGPKTNVKWKIPVPPGLSSPIIVGNRLVLTSFDKGKLFTIAYDRYSGRQLWRADARAARIEPYQKDAGSPAASTAATDGKRIVVYFGSCGLICYDLGGRELWRFKLPMAEIYGGYGSGTSPIVAGGLAILVRDVASGSRIVAVDLASGKLRWETKRLSRASWGTPVVWHAAGGPQVVSTGHGAMIGYDLKTGAERWKVNCMPSGCASSPVVADGVLYFAGWTPGAAGDKSSAQPSFDSFLTDLDKDKSGDLSRAEAGKTFGSFFDNYDLNRDGKITREEYEDQVNLLLEGKNAAYAIKSGGAGDITESHMLWKRTRGMGYTPSAIYYRGRYVMVKDGGIVTGLDAKSGKELFVERLGAPGAYMASPVAANGNIYFASQEGVVTVLRPGTSGAKVIFKSPKLDEHISATPAIAGNTLYVRTNKSLYAFGERDAKTPGPVTAVH